MISFTLGEGPGSTFLTFHATVFWHSRCCQRWVFWVLFTSPPTHNLAGERNGSWLPFPISHSMTPYGNGNGKCRIGPSLLGIGQTMFQSPPMPQKTFSGAYLVVLQESEKSSFRQPRLCKYEKAWVILNRPPSNTALMLIIGV